MFVTGNSVGFDMNIENIMSRRKALGGLSAGVVTLAAARKSTLAVFRVVAQLWIVRHHCVLASDDIPRRQKAAKWKGISAVYEQAAMSDLNALFQIENDRELFHKVRDWIFAAKCEPMESYNSYSPRLSEGERYVILAWGFVAETTNGGIHQFLTNATGDHAEETREAMHRIGATLAAKTLDATREALFGDKPIPSDPILREDVLSAWDDKHGKGSANRFLDKYDRDLYEGEFGEIESIEKAIAGYIRDNHEMFG
jgi:Domain of unknown function (DUF4375)